MAWTTPPTWATNDIPSATDLNNLLRDNANYLLSGRPNSQIYYDNGANYTTTSTSFANVDGTNLIITLTIISGKALVWFTGSASVAGGAAPFVGFDLTVDGGTRQGNSFTYGLLASATTQSPYTLIYLVTGLSAGSHTFRLQWKVNTGATGTLRSGSGTGVDDIGLGFGAIEVG